MSFCFCFSLIYIKISTKNRCKSNVSNDVPIRISTSSLRSGVSKPGATGGTKCVRKHNSNKYSKRVRSNNSSVFKQENYKRSALAKEANSKSSLYQSNSQIVSEIKRCGCSKGNYVCRTQNCSCVQRNSDCTELCHKNKQVNCCNKIIILN